MRCFTTLAISALALLASCSSSPEPISKPTPVGMWIPDKGAMLTAMQAKLSEGHPSYRHLDAEMLENLVERTRVHWTFGPDHTYTMDFEVDLGSELQRVQTQGTWMVRDGLLCLVEKQNSCGQLDPYPVVGVFDGEAMHIEKDQMTLVLYRR